MNWIDAAMARKVTDTAAAWIYVKFNIQIPLQMAVENEILIPWGLMKICSWMIQ